MSSVMDTLGSRLVVLSTSTVVLPIPSIIPSRCASAVSATALHALRDIVVSASALIAQQLCVVVF
jgi:hypothetical protein